MRNNPYPVNSIDFLSELPAFYARGLDGADSMLLDFLRQFEEMFSGLQAAIVGDTLKLTCGELAAEADMEPGQYPIIVDIFDAGHLGYPKNATVSIPGNPDTTFLAQPIEAATENIGMIYVTDKNFLSYLAPGVKLTVSTGDGLSGLTSIRDMPPPAFLNLGEQDKLAYLQYLASWVGLPVRSDKTVSWNRRFLREAITMDNNTATLRSTMPGIRAMLNAWHKGEIVAENTIVTDLISPANGVNTVFRIGESRIGVDTMFGEDETGHFHVYLTTDPNDVSMRNQKKIDAMTAAAKLLLDMEKPVNMTYTLHIQAHTMQLAVDGKIPPYKNSPGYDPSAIDEDMLSLDETNTYARIGVTTLLWD